MFLCLLAFISFWVRLDLPCANHVRLTSKHKDPNRFVSLSTSPAVALYYARCKGEMLQRVVRVDLRRLRPSRLIDVSTEEAATAAGLGPEAKCCTGGDGELLYLVPELQRQGVADSEKIFQDLGELTAEEILEAFADPETTLCKL